MPSITPNIADRDYWLSLEQLAGSPEFAEQAQHEFQGYDPDQLKSTSRRTFLKFMGGSMALAGLTLTGCRRYPERKIAPFAHRPADRVPGVSQRYATMLEKQGVALGLLVSNYDGRPIKIEGNPLHPDSQGSTDAIAQASVLDLYDPQRSRHPMQRVDGKLKRTTPAALDTFIKRHFESLATTQGKGLAILVEPSDSPTLVAQKKALLAKLPQARWYTYHPLQYPDATDATRMAFGRNLRPQYHLDQAKLIVSFDHDFLSGHSASLRWARDWAAGRADPAPGSMNRLVTLESTLSNTGIVADTRYAMTVAEVSRMIVCLAAALDIDEAKTLAAQLPQTTKAQQWQLQQLVLQLTGHVGKVALFVGPHLPQSVQALVHVMHARLNAIGSTVNYTAEPLYPENNRHIFSLLQAMQGGEINTLVILGGNPAYTLPADAPFTEAMAKVETKIHLAESVNETTVLCDWHMNQAHYLECWADGRGWDGTITVGQPMILPLYAGKSIPEFIAMLHGDPARDGYELVRNTFRGLLNGPDFERAWRRVLHNGLIEDSAYPTVDRLAAKPVALSNQVKDAADGFELRLVPDASLYDGRHANNAWLQEVPDPVSKVTWDNPLLISAADAGELGLKTGDMVKISVGAHSLEAGVMILPGQPKGALTMALGFGRSVCGTVGTKVGFNSYDLLAIETGFVPGSVRLEKLGRTYKFALTQDHFAMNLPTKFAETVRIGTKQDGIGLIVREGTVEEFAANDELVHKNEHGDMSLKLFPGPMEDGPKRPGGPEQFNDPHAWGMSVDMNSCIGCNACVVACQAENNVPVVGKDQVAVSREMHWLRIDRYFKGDPFDANDIQTIYQPMMCVHCENAPCEQVCPVAATVHDSEGLNTMVYNRCIGTRYCSNNCPYKVRRFNYFDFQSKDPRKPAENWLGIPDQHQLSVIDEIKRMVYNPDVTVRMRGVMEKCTYCVQRIAAAKIDAKNQWAKGDRDEPLVKDGEVTTACQQVCPTQAIVFGNLNDPASRVSKLQQSNRSYAVLENLNTKPRTQYLAKVRNPIA